MHNREILGEGYLSIYQGDVDEDKQNANIKNKRVDEDLTLIIGTTGCGKSVFTDSYVEELYRHKYTIIYLTEKIGDEYAPCYRQHPPETEWHLKMLAEQKVKPNFMKLKTYHPFTFELPYRKKIPKMTFFTFPIKSIDEETFASLLTGDVDAQAIRVLGQIVKKLPDDANIWDLASFLSELVKDKNRQGASFVDDSYSFFIDLNSNESKVTIQKILNALKPFIDVFCLSSSSDPHNLDYSVLINDQEHIHAFTTKFITENRMKYFCIIVFLNSLIKAIESNDDPARFKICLVLEEVKFLLPKGIKSAFEENLNRLLVKTLATVRIKGRGVKVLATTQNLYGTEPKFRSSVSSKILMRMCTEDMAKLKKEFALKDAKSQILQSLTRGECIVLEDFLNPDKVECKYYSFVPSHCTAEADFGDYVRFCEKRRPELLMAHTEVYKEMELIKKEAEKMARNRQEAIKKEKEAKKDADAKTVQKVDDVKVQMKEKAESEVAKAVKRNTKDLIKESNGKRAYFMKKDDSNLSWRSISEDLGVSSPTAKKIALDYARECGDNEFLEYNGGLI